MGDMTDNIDEQREGRVVAAIPADTYAHRLMLARAHAGHLSIREAADKCGLNYASWANWERGTRSRSQVDDAEVIAEVLAVDLHWLLYGGPLTPLIKSSRLRATSVRRHTHPGVRRPRRISGAPRRVAA
jgi:hypothetical protein